MSRTRGMLLALGAVTVIVVPGAAWAANVTGADEVAAGPARWPVLGALEAVVPGSLLGAALAIIIKITGDRFSEIRRKYREAGLLGIELTHIAEVIREASLVRGTSTASYKRLTIPSNVYNGLVISGSLADYDRSLQDALYRFYWKGSLGEYEHMNRAIGGVITGVRSFKAANAPGLKPALGRLARCLGGGSGGGSGSERGKGGLEGGSGGHLQAGKGSGPAPQGSGRAAEEAGSRAPV